MAGWVIATGVASDELASAGGYSLLRRMEVGGAGLGVYLCIAALPIITLRIVNRL